MKKFGSISVAVIGAALLIGFAFGGLANLFQSPTPLSNAVITIKGDPGKCVATTDLRRMEGQRNKKVNWKINDPSNCLLENIEVELRFTAGDPFYVLSGPPKGKRDIDKWIQPFARRNVPFPYKVWAVGPGTEYEMEDPVLEIVQ